MEKQLDNHLRLTDEKYLWHRGDCFELLEKIPDGMIDLIITSPPYNIGKEYENKLNLGEYLSFSEKLISHFFRVLSPSGSICYQTGNYVENGEIIPIDSLLYRSFTQKGFKLRNRIVWAFEHGMHARHKFSGRHEVISWYSKSDDYTFHLDPIRVPQKQPTKKFYKGPKKGQISSNPLGKNPGDVWNITNVKNGHPEKIDGGHPCQFPMELAERLILSMSNKGGVVLDPFGGVATTLVASLKHDRLAISSEIDKDYHKLGKQRIAQLKKGTLPYKGRFQLNNLEIKD